MLETVAINLTALHSAGLAEYLSTADRRITYGFRLALETIGVPLPEVAMRKPSGPRSIRELNAAYHADNPVEAIKDRQEQLEAGWTKSKARQARQNG